MNDDDKKPDQDGADLLALASAADHQVASDAALPGSQAMQEQQAAQAAQAEQEEADEITAALCLAVQFAGYVEPLAPRYYNPQACSEIAAGYLACAAKYGWTWHKALATGPEVKLALAIAVPGFLMYRERQALLDQAQHQARETHQAHQAPPVTPPSAGERMASTS